MSKEHGGKREGAGRPAKYEDAQVVHVRVPGAVVQALDDLASEQGTTRADVVVGILLKAKAVRDRIARK